MMRRKRERNPTRCCEETSSRPYQRGIEFEDHGERVVAKTCRKRAEQFLVGSRFDRGEGRVVEYIIAGTGHDLSPIQIHRSIATDDEHHFGAIGAVLSRKVLRD